MEERISGIEDKVEEMITSVKENEMSNLKKIQAQYIQEIMCTMKRPNLWIIGIEDEEKTLLL